MSFYSELATTADELLAEFGQPVTVRHTESVYNPATGTSTPTETNTPTVAAKFPYGDEMVDGTLILSGDEQVFMSSVKVQTVVPSDRLVFTSGTFVVVRVKTTDPAGTPVIHELQVRK